VLGVGGSLLESGARRGRQTIGLLASDQGAGIKSRQAAGSRTSDSGWEGVRDAWQREGRLSG
jgi:hypothetical protein